MNAIGRWLESFTSLRTYAVEYISATGSSLAFFSSVVEAVALYGIAWPPIWMVCSVTDDSSFAVASGGAFASGAFDWSAAAGSFGGSCACANAAEA